MLCITSYSNFKGKSIGVRLYTIKPVCVGNEHHFGTDWRKNILSRFKVGDTCYFIESGMNIIEGIVIAVEGDFYVLKYDIVAGIRLRGKRVYATIAEAQKAMSVKKHGTPWDFL